jgi:Domain of unknown function (DUF1707)
MSHPSGPSGPNGSALRKPPSGQALMRVSDADRAEVADRLAKHYSDGRLDQAEFDERLDQAMRAKTRADLSGLLADLPGEAPLVSPVPPLPPDAGRREKRQLRQLLRVQLEREREMLRHERREHRRQLREHRWYSIRQLPVLVLAVVVILVTGRVLREIYSLWLVLAVLGFLWLVHVQRSRRS